MAKSDAVLAATLKKDQTEAPKHTFPLAAFKGRAPEAPAWFQDALAHPKTDGHVEVAGAQIAWRRWDAPGRKPQDAPGLIFVHGGLAHLGWWDFIAPFFSDAWTPMALSLSGMGESDHREVYSADTFTDEIIAAAEAAGLAFDHPDQRPVLIGHSFGAMMSGWTAVRHGKRLSGAVLLDIPVTPPKPQKVEGDGTSNRRGGRVYDDLAAALARFRLMPNQDCAHLYVVDHIARGAIKTVPYDGGEGFTWRHDPDLWLKRDRDDRFEPVQAVEQVQCPIAILRGADSKLVPDDIWTTMRQFLSRDIPMITVPEAAHHVFLDQPLATVSALRGLLSAWPQAVSSQVT